MNALTRYDAACRALAEARSVDVGDLPLLSITPRAADKLYARLCEDGKLRRGEKAVT